MVDCFSCRYGMMVLVGGFLKCICRYNGKLIEPRGKCPYYRSFVVRYVLLEDLDSEEPEITTYESLEDAKADFEKCKRDFEEYWQDPDSCWMEGREEYARKVLERQGFKVMRVIEAITDEKSPYYLALVEVMSDVRKKG